VVALQTSSGTNRSVKMFMKKATRLAIYGYLFKGEQALNL
jgi:hypothetical protein